MANIDAAFGLYPVGHLLNGQYDGRANKYYVPSSNATTLMVGDPVKSTGTGNTTTGLASVARAAAGDTMRGVIVGIVVDAAVAATKHPGYLPASTEGYVHVCDDPYVIFEVQEDSDATTLDATDIGATGDLVIGAGSTTTGRSGVELDSSNVGTGGGVKILGLAQREGNELGANAVWQVVINEHEFNAAVAGV